MKCVRATQVFDLKVVWLAALVVGAVGLGCKPAASGTQKKAPTKSEKAEAVDPVKSFEKILSSIESQIASPREYLERSVGNFAQLPNFAGNPEDAGKPYEHYNKLKIEWRIKGYDVKKTDSLVSPFVAILVLEERRSEAYNGETTGPVGQRRSVENARIERPEDVLDKPCDDKIGEWIQEKCTYSWRDGKWIPDKQRWPFDPTRVPREEDNQGKGSHGFSYKRLK